MEVFKMSNEKIRLFKMKGACCTYIISYPAVQKNGQRNPDNKKECKRKGIIKMRQLSNKMNQYITENYFTTIKKLKSYFWGKYVKTLKTIGVDEDTFYALCDEIIVENIDSYNSEISSIKTYLTIILQNKINTYIKAQNADKRVANISATYLSETVSDDTDRLVQDELAAVTDVYKEIEDKLMVKAVMESLRNDKERAYVQMILDGYTESEICEKLKVTQRYINDIKVDIPLRVEVRRIMKVISNNGRLK